MKSLELQPTDENILKTFSEDKLQRNEHVFRFITLLNSLEDHHSIALDGRWGSGKTFFVKQVKMLLESFSGSEEFLKHEESQKNKTYIERRYNIQIQPQIPIYYDAWINDNDEDPIISLMYSIIQDINYNLFTPSFRKNYLGQLADFVLEAISICQPSLKESIQNYKNLFNKAKNISQCSEAPEFKELLAPIKKQEQIYDEIKKLFDTILNNSEKQCKRLVIFIDELDRCKPDYALKLLERIKHYFYDDRITFVFSVNVDELQHMVKCCYGSECSASRYLDRFFDLRASLPELDVKAYLKDLYPNLGMFTVRQDEDSFKLLVKTYHLSLREISKFLLLMKIMTNRKMEIASRAYDSVFYFCETFVLPVMICLKLTDQSKYQEFIEGKNSLPLLALLDSEQVKNNIYDSIFNNNKSDVNSRSTYRHSDKELNEELEKIYYYLFNKNKDFNYSNGENINDLNFDETARNFLMDTVTLLSYFADFK